MSSSKRSRPLSYLSDEFLPTAVDDSTIPRLKMMKTHLLGTIGNEGFVDFVKNKLSEAVSPAIIQATLPGFINKEIYRAYEQKLIKDQQYQSPEKVMPSLCNAIARQMSTICDKQVDYALGIPLYYRNPTDIRKQRDACKLVIECTIQNIIDLFPDNGDERIEIEAQKFAHSCARTMTHNVNKGLREYIDRELHPSRSDGWSQEFYKEITRRDDKPDISRS